MSRDTAYTLAELEEAVEANTEFTSCPLPHVGPINDYHKEPYIPTHPGEAANYGLTRTVLHMKDPAGIYHTTVSSVWPEPVSAPLALPCTLDPVEEEEPDPEPGPPVEVAVYGLQTYVVHDLSVAVWATRLADAGWGLNGPTPPLITTNDLWAVSDRDSGSGIFSVERGLMHFNTTSSVPPGGTLLTAKLRLCTYQDNYSEDGSDFHVVPHTALATATAGGWSPNPAATDRHDIDTTDILATSPILGHTVDVPFDLDLPTSAINLGGYTRLAIVTEHDVAGGAAPTGVNQAFFIGCPHSLWQAPQFDFRSNRLILTYQPA